MKKVLDMVSESPSSHILSTAAQYSPESSATGEVIDAPHHPDEEHGIDPGHRSDQEHDVRRVIVQDDLPSPLPITSSYSDTNTTIGGHGGYSGYLQSFLNDFVLTHQDDHSHVGRDYGSEFNFRYQWDPIHDADVAGEWEAGGEEDNSEAGEEDDSDDDGEWEEDDNIENREGTGETRGASSRNMPFYAGNPGDYLDARGFEQLLEHLAETENSGRGAPPAAQSVIEQLPLTVIRQAHEEDGSLVCTICQDSFALGEQAKQLPCMHLYHPHCILPWLCAKNSCPVCRYELPTDDPEYEEEKGNAGRRTNNNYHGQNFNQENSSELSADTQDLENAVLEQQPDAENLLGASRTLGNRSVADRFADLLAELGRANY